MSMKKSMTTSGIEPAIFRFVAQHLNHCATAVPAAFFTSWNKYQENWRTCYRFKPIDGDLTRLASDWHSYRIHDVGISLFLKEAKWNEQPENAIHIDIKEVKSSPVGVTAEHMLLH
jgi:hypothetical protein